jgi:hypothetical protein
MSLTPPSIHSERSNRSRSKSPAVIETNKSTPTPTNIELIETQMHEIVPSLIDLAEASSSRSKPPASAKS